ncbi:MAG: hypothetical protein JJ977_18580 [Kordiimonadaceae bacterium]|nr:hypothetical protein [Kordiimonadaceae bacterium]
MDDEEFELIYSPLCQKLSSGGRTVDIQIYGDGNGKWLLEIEDEYGNSTVWDDPFETDSQALLEAKKSILKDRVTKYIGPEDGKGDGNWR